MEKNYLSVAQVNNYIRQIFDSELMLKNICIYGEISSYNVSNGIAYFNIKDNDNLLSCVLFGANRFIAPKLGDLVLVTGSISYYAKGGRLSFNATKIEPYGRGMLYEKFLELKNKLEQKGYFDESIKKTIPKRVKNIGVVTSPTGAVIKDIIDVSTRRNNSVNIIIYPSKVQGLGAELEIAKGINFFSDYKKIDTIIVARGGGSLEDLQPFNSEVVANAAYNCKKPLVSAVGHETDFTILDFVSDLRAPTPSAAAELVVNSKQEDYNAISINLNKIERGLNLILNKLKYQIFSYTDKIYSKLNVIENITKTEIKASTNNIEKSINTKLEKYENDFKLLTSVLNNLNPTNLISKGYTKIENLQGGVVRSVNHLKVGQDIGMFLKDGKIFANVNKIKNKEKE